LAVDKRKDLKVWEVIKNKNWTKVFTFIIICIQLYPKRFS